MVLSFEKLSDDELIFETREAIRIETEATSQVVRLFREIESRELYLLKGYSSLFAIAVEGLGYCAGSAQLRINAMRLIDSVPDVEWQLESGELSLTAASKIQTFFKAEEKSNKAYSQAERTAVVQDCLKKSTREVERELARKNPDILIYETTKPVGEDRFQLTFTITRELEAKIRKLKSLLAHSKPNMTNEELLESLTNLGLEKHDPAAKAERAARRIAKHNSSHKSELIDPADSFRNGEFNGEGYESLAPSGSEVVLPLSSNSTQSSLEGPRFRAREVALAGAEESGAQRMENDSFHTHQMKRDDQAAIRSRYIPTAIRNEVWLRNRGDGCEYADQETERRCGSQQALQLDHAKEFALGGEHTSDNLRVLCAKHNRFVWRRRGGISFVREIMVEYAA